MTCIADNDSGDQSAGVGKHVAIKTNQLPIKSLFEQNNTFAVPKYQRGYAWDDEAVTDFINDVGRCLAKRMAGGALNHFFGGIVTVRVDVPGSPRSNFEVIDGQQRLASLVLLVAAIIHQMKDTIGALEKKAKLSKEETKAKTFLVATVEALDKLYLNFIDSVDMEYVPVHKLTLSQADNDFYRGLLEGDAPKATRASQSRLATAWEAALAFVRNVVFKDASLSEVAQRIQLLVDQVFVKDCTVIFMASDTRSEAYQIFQVLNDRGVHLTDGDLLRARTMERLDDKALTVIQNSLAEAWDSVLAYEASDIDSYLRWYMASHEGRRPTSSALADQFLNSRFKTAGDAPISKLEAKAVLGEVRQIDTEFALLATMGDGEWPFPHDKKVVRWDRERLRMLVGHLKHTNAMPLLLALHTLGAEKFAQAVASLERFVFRYKTIGNAHVSPMTDLYHRHAKAIRADPNKYKLGTLRSELLALVDEKVPLDVFEANLRQVKYNPRGGNGHIRYMLIALEDFRGWYDKGANGQPKAKDKTKVFDFSNTTLEHVYPRSAVGNDKVAAMEPLKDELGNLAIFGPQDNDALANKPFSGKKAALAKSSLQLNRDIGAHKTWSKASITARTDDLIEMALKIFVP